MQEREWRPDWPCPVGQILAVARRGAGDPTYRIEPDGAHWRAVRTPEGPGTLRVEQGRGTPAIRASTWGPGATWLLEMLPSMLGADDDWTGFEARHPAVERARRNHPHWRIGRTGLVMEALLPAVLEQKVTGQEAFLGFRRLVRRYGERAPGPHEDLWLQPTPRRLVEIPSWEWLAMHVDGARSRTVVGAARVARALERTTGLDRLEADRRLRSVPGIGVWTSAETRVRAHGDPDAVSFGDYHVAKDIGWALTGAPVDDTGLAEILREWSGHRHRVQALLALDGQHRPRRGPRMAPRRHLPG
ncbi:DNA-3-methyladenine glycosylase family protein [Nocardioides jensenii]|uniref:DNA-3-methyladenine glycosylase family protein n=1 Tax=Nocardioides jensenii TaxID=1843 RepID=UPI000A44DADC|nr:DNA-3-methyladenine glycosylase 2 family protein [Nocardioides jensenii]